MPKLTMTYSGENLFPMGMGQVVIARFKNDGRVEIGGVLLDTFCLGVKDAFFVQGDEEVLQDMVERIAETSGAVEEHSGAWGRKLVEAAANYARRLGFAPHRDYKKAARVLGGIDPKDWFCSLPVHPGAGCRKLPRLLSRLILGVRCRPAVPRHLCHSLDPAAAPSGAGPRRWGLG